MCHENMVGPEELLVQYKKYEYLLNIDRKQLINDLLNKPITEENKVSKVSLQEIRKQLL